MNLVLFKKGYLLTSKGDKRKKLEILFNMYDLDNNGYIDKDEIKKVVKSCLKLHNTELGEKGLNKLVTDCFEELDTSRNGKISKSMFKSLNLNVLGPSYFLI